MKGKVLSLTIVDNELSNFNKNFEVCRQEKYKLNVAQNPKFLNRTKESSYKNGLVQIKRLPEGAIR